jgi:hypothetical protein
MSASIFADFYIPYSSYLKTEYIEGDIKFGELKPGDILYYLDRYDKMKTIKVISSWHIYKNHYYIGVSEKLRNVDFGETNCANALESKNASIAYYQSGYIGTNKESVIKIAIQKLSEEYDKMTTQLQGIQKELNELNNQLNEIY